MKTYIHTYTRIIRTHTHIMIPIKIIDVSLHAHARLHVCMQAHTCTSMCKSEAGVPSACMQHEQCEHHSTHPPILLPFLPVPQGAVPADKHELPGPQSASKGSSTITDGIPVHEATSVNKFNNIAPGSLQVLFWPSHVSCFADTPHSRPSLCPLSSKPRTCCHTSFSSPTTFSGPPRQLQEIGQVQDANPV